MTWVALLYFRPKYQYVIFPAFINKTWHAFLKSKMMQ